jgi:hypothetical protein
MERRLADDYGFKRASEKWLAAWRLTKEPAPADAPSEKSSTTDKPADAAKSN